MIEAGLYFLVVVLLLAGGHIAESHIRAKRLAVAACLALAALAAVVIVAGRGWIPLA